MITVPKDPDPVQDPVSRTRFREVLSDVVVRAKVSLPESAGRIDKAAALVLAGDVELFYTNGTARVGSGTDIPTSYVVTGARCVYKDVSRAPLGYCKQVIDVMILTRVQQALAAEVPAPEPPAPDLPDGDSLRAEAPAPAPVPALPEMPCSVNVHVTIAGRDVLVTLRGTDEGEVLRRLAKVLQRYPVEPASARSNGALIPVCGVHNEPMKPSQHLGGSFYCSKKNSEDTYCTERF